MDGLLLINKILVASIVSIGSGLAIVVYRGKPKSRINRLFSLLAILCGVWASFVYLAFTTQDRSVALFWSRPAEVAVIFILINLYFFAVYFPRESKRSRILDWVVILFGIVFLILALFTNLITKDAVQLKGWGFSPVLGRMGFMLNGGSLFITFLVLYFLVKKYFRLTAEEKIRMQYFLVGIVFFILANVVFNIGWPMLLGEYRYAQIGTSSTIFLLFFTALAIVKQHLFGIKVVLTEFLVAGMGITLLVLPLLMPTIFLRLLTLAIFVLFLIFGYYLIKATREESERRERAEKLAREAKRLAQEKDQFILSIQHHLRTPLTAVRGYLSMILDGDYGQETNPLIRSKLLLIQKSANILHNLMEDLLDVQQMRLGKGTLDLEKCYLEEIVSSIIEELKPEAEKKGIYLRFVHNSPLPPLKLDKRKIREAIWNLVDNGIKYTEKGGVEIKLGKAKEGKGKEKVKIIISDTGIGMSKKEIRRFLKGQLFERGERAKHLYGPGRGIGLTLAKEFVRAHRGNFKIESGGEGKGTTVIIELPLKKV